MPLNPVTRPVLARVLGLTVHGVARLEREGIIRPVSPARRGVPSRYALAVVVPAYVATLRGREPARERRDRSLAELNELRLQERRHELVPRDQVIREGQGVVKAVRARVLAMPRRLVQLGLVSPDQERAVTAVSREACAEMATWATSDVIGWAQRADARGQPTG